MERTLPYGKEYTLVSRYKSISELSRSVNNHIAMGWRAQGGISVTYDNDAGAILFVQAMVRE